MPAPSLPTSPAGLMWRLALAGVLLAVTKACIFCRLQDRDLSGRLARLISQMEPQWKEWASPDFSAFALDEVTMNKVTEKTHRVLRVIEIKRSLSLLPPYWQWLQKTQIPQYIWEALCAPVCRGSTILYNCSTCKAAEVPCWPRHRCYPGSHDLWEARILLLSVSGTALLIGIVILQVESRQLQAEGAW